MKKGREPIVFQVPGMVRVVEPRGIEPYNRQSKKQLKMLTSHISVGLR